MQVEQQTAKQGMGGLKRSSALCAGPVRKLWRMGSWQRLCASCSARSLARGSWIETWHGI